ncbi:hypothetical protein Psi02_01080 [Planotetraspora silvatica]|uniref:Uncharacterized protein n=1 Tax=Planotetraspora silvatica TaxID=234614 RepID=A0A8J3XJR2_9ACTN|nr:hypothetical protein Psi02_01080 [Planotetraspora silvatica]
MTRLLIAEDIGQHRGEAVHRLRVLPVGRHEIGVLKGVERTVRKRMAVQQQQAGTAGGRFTLRHTRSLVSVYDTNPGLFPQEGSL